MIKHDSTVIAMVNEVTRFENNFNGGLIHGYKGNTEEFKKDLENSIRKDGANEVLDYYRSYFKSSNSTNSNEEKRKELSGIILMLEGFIA